MDPAASLAAWVALAGGTYLALAAALDGFRLVTRLRLPALPSLRPLLAALAVAGVLGRSAPALAALPPPALRLGPDRGGVAAAAPVVTTADPVALDPAPGSSYVVRAGDSLWAIASSALGGSPPAAVVDDYWRATYRANVATIGTDPHLIHPGQVLRLPERP